MTLDTSDTSYVAFITMVVLECTPRFIATDRAGFYSGAS